MKKKWNQGISFLGVLMAATVGLMTVLGVMQLLEISNKQQLEVASKIDFQQMTMSINLMLSHLPLCEENFKGKKIITSQFTPPGESIDWKNFKLVPELTEIVFDGDVVVPDPQQAGKYNVKIKVLNPVRGEPLEGDETSILYTAEFSVMTEPKSNLQENSKDQKTQSSSSNPNSASTSSAPIHIHTVPIKLIVDETQMIIPEKPPIIKSCFIKSDT